MAPYMVKNCPLKSGEAETGVITGGTLNVEITGTWVICVNGTEVRHEVKTGIDARQGVDKGTEIVCATA